MKSRKTYMALDVGVSSGRVIVAGFDGSSIESREAFRFRNSPVNVRGTVFTDILRIFYESTLGVQKSLNEYGDAASMGIDVWGVDFGLLDRDGQLISNPISHRDSRLAGITEKVFSVIDKKDIYYKTGVHFQVTNSLYQVFAMKELNPGFLERAGYFLMLGDLLNYYFTGQISCEYTGAVTTQMFDLGTGTWQDDIIGKLGVDRKIFLDVVQPGTFSGYIRDDIVPGLPAGQLKVIRSAYDTSSEIAAIPASRDTLGRAWAFLCCGTTGTAGMVSSRPIIGEKGFRYEFGNEGGLEGTFNFLKNFTCMWIIENCRNRWMAERNREISWEEIEKASGLSAENDIFIDVDDDIFSARVADMPSAVLEYCRRTGQVLPRTMGEVARCVFESYVLKIASILDRLEQITGKKMEVLHLTGGGSKNHTFCQWISDALALPVIAGPAETTAWGNILIQLKADSEISGLEEGRVLLGKSLDLRQYQPEAPGKWEARMKKYIDVISKGKKNNDRDGDSL